MICLNYAIYIFYFLATDKIFSWWIILRPPPETRTKRFLWENINDEDLYGLTGLYKDEMQEIVDAVDVNVKQMKSVFCFAKVVDP